ncbi:hypothetical protein HY988_04195 [Candidatus Micrarchaeota archaeon]|nr:hypothetical protein [Candidatus Micrarchaeota archaeon]
MIKEFWNDSITKASWSKLTELSKEFDFIVIGGWAAYLWTKAHKSKDIDIAVDYSELQKLSDKFLLQKNERLRKYEIKLEQFDIDIYLPKFSKLALPVADLKNYETKIEGIKTVQSEALFVLKQAAEIDRRGSIKGRKDGVDLLTLLIYSGFAIGKYRQILKTYNLAHFEKELVHVVTTFSQDDLNYLGMNTHSFSKWKKDFLMQLKS